MDFKKEIRDLFSRGGIRWALCLFFGALVLFLVFDAGMAAGARRAVNLYHARGPGRTLPHSDFLPHGFLPEGHGTVGTIVSISLPTVTIETREGERKNVLLSTSTTLHGFSRTGRADLQTGRNVVVIGEPTNIGEIKARFIRILPGSATTSRPN